MSEEIPQKLTWRQFELLCVERLRWEHDQGRGHFSRYGVKVNVIDKKKIQPLRSLPDLEGALPPDGRQIIVECKVISTTRRLSLTDKTKRAQCKHMLKRSEVGVPCCFLIHMNARNLVRSQQPAETVAFPVHVDHPFWKVYQQVETNIDHHDLAAWGIPVVWNSPGRTRTLRPDILRAVEEVRKRVFPLSNPLETMPCAKKINSSPSSKAVVSGQQSLPW